MATTTTARSPGRGDLLAFSPRSSVSGGSSGAGSVASTASSSTCLPRRRIRCTGSRIAVGERNFQSATDALAAYLKQFEEGGEGAASVCSNGGTDQDKSNLEILGRLGGSAPGEEPGSSVSSRAVSGGIRSNGSATSGTKSVLTNGSANEDKAPGSKSKVGGPQSSVTQAQLTGKGLAGSGLVLAPHGIALAGCKNDVEDLLTSKVSPKLQEEVTDTMREVKLRRLLKQAALKSKDQTKTGLQQEVEAALVRSAKLLEKVTREDISSTRAATLDTSITSALETSNSCNSSSLNLELEALLLGHAAADSNVDVEKKGEEDAQSLSSLPSTPRRTNSHTHSYHRPSRPRQRQTTSSDLTDRQTLQSSRALSHSVRSIPLSYPSLRRPRASSIDSLLPSSIHASSINASIQLLLDGKDPGSEAKRESCSSDSSPPSNHSDPTDLLQQIRSRSVSPGQHRGLLRELTAATAPDWVHQLDESVRKSVPSWVGEISPSEISDSAWVREGLLEDANNRRPPNKTSDTLEEITKLPSWVGHAEESDANDRELLEMSEDYRPALLPMVSTPVKPLGGRGEGTGILQQSPSIPNGSSFVAGDGPILAANLTLDSLNDSSPGLNLPDLNSSRSRGPGNNGNSNGSKHVTFTDSIETDSIQVPHSRRPGSTNGLSPTKGTLRNRENQTSSANNRPANRNKLGFSPPRPSRVLDSEYNGESVLRNSILPQTARLKRSMENFRASSENLLRTTGSPLSPTSSESSGGGGSGSSANGKACSSLDTVALLTGQPLTRSHRQPQLNVKAGESGVDLESSSDGLDGDRSWERMVNTIKAPVPVGTSGDPAASNGYVTNQIPENTLSGGRQPGSMEALKNMLFKLQAEETSAQNETSKRDKNNENQDGHLQNTSHTSMAIIPALENYDFRQEPGGHSLEKALVHLNRLKKLVKTGPAPSTAANNESNGTPEAIEKINSQSS